MSTRLPSVAICIPTIPERKDLLTRAIESVLAQTYEGVLTTHVVLDNAGLGACATRQTACSDALEENPTYLAFLDDDDELMPDHITTLVNHALLEDADVVWPWFNVVGGSDPFPQHRGRQWDANDPHIFPITALVRADKFCEVGGFISEPPTVDPNHPESGRMVAGEDWRLWLRLSAAGAKFSHVNAVTWTWHHDSGNTSGLPSNRRR